MSDRSLSELGEQGLLPLLQAFCPAEQRGDDAAILTPPAGQQLVVSSDVLVEGIHFSEATTPPAAIGWRAAAANLSDLAAMGATPAGITLALALPSDRRLSWLQQIYQGLDRCLKQYDCPLIGGDLSRSPTATLAVTALGWVSPNRVIRRSTAQVGDWIIATGLHGLSRLGLGQLLEEWVVPESLREQAIAAHQTPKPRLDVVPLLARSQPAGTVWRVAGMDSSDGLADAVLQICRASQVGAVIEALPLPATTSFDRDRLIQAALYGGEDFELVLCLSPDWAQALLELLGEQAQVIGQITEKPVVQLRLSDRTEILSLDRGFQHFTTH
ncbi:thiamine-phosphate kinase [Synechococcus elongatus]|uniref:thiamine-phosphate kinase n=1 Tax=Synechococcus elongatus TaxID=32046 RepID=UPI000F7F7012|nr:thiamine-phosphate kinase [Synechococcus elongatus]